MVARTRDAEKVRLYYLGGLVPHPGAKDKKTGEEIGKESFIIRGNDRPYMVENKFGAFIDVSNIEQARDIVLTHRVINSRGEFAAFTQDPKVVNRIREQRERVAQGRDNQEPAEEKKLSRAELLKMLAEMPEEEE